MPNPTPTLTDALRALGNRLADCRCGNVDLTDADVTMLRQAADALLTAPPAEGWQPIETAPKHGWILLKGKSGYINRPYRAHVGRWVTRPCGADSRSSIGWWEESESGRFTDDGAEPTHWMPLPDPPKEPYA